MKKLLLFTSLVLISSCKKDETVKPSYNAISSSSLPSKPIDELLTGGWTMTWQIVEGPLVHINVHEVPLTIQVTPTYWVNPTFPLSISGHTLTIPVYHRFGSDSTWQIDFSDHNNFTLHNVITSGFYKGAMITDSYQRVY